MPAALTRALACLFLPCGRARSSVFPVEPHRSEDRIGSMGMMKDDLRKPMLEKKVQAAPAPSVSSPQELTCTEGQIEDLLAEGETTESDAENDDVDDSLERTSTSAAERKSLSSTKSNRKQK